VKATVTSAHLSLGVRLPRVHILVVRSLPVSRSTGLQVRKSALCHNPLFMSFFGLIT